MLVLHGDLTSNKAFLIVFLSGALFSIVLFIIGHHIDQTFKTQLKHFDLSSDNDLQVRDEYSVYAPYVDLPLGQNKNVPPAEEVRENENEALGSLRVALEMNAQGKDDKAFRLFQHALALSPKHPEILTKYGEFLEHIHGDIVAADQMYFQALVVQPKHAAALENRLRTAHRVAVIDRERLERLDQKRKALSSIQDSHSGLRRAKKEAYIQNIYHSVGIEGNTMSLAQTRAILETRMAVEGKSIDEHNEILGLDSAMKYINATLVNK
jgi:tetratricopeptide (TPR) repeat protein